MKHIIKTIYGDIIADSPIIWRSVSMEIAELGSVNVNEGLRKIAIKGKNVDGWHIEFHGGGESGEYAPATDEYHVQCPWIHPLLDELFAKATEKCVEVIDLRARTYDGIKKINPSVFTEGSI